MSENWYNKFVIRKFSNILYDKDTNKELAFFKLKTTFDFNEKCIIVDQLPAQFEKFIYGTPLPRDVKEIGTLITQLESNSIEDEINWLFLSIRKYKDKINEFLSLKYKFDNCLILGNYKEAEHILDEVEKNICFSLWGMENRLLLKELTGGIDENKILLSKINKEKGNHYVTQLADFFSKKAENDMPINRYSQEVRNFANKLVEPFKLENIEYYYFKVNYLEYERYQTNCVISTIEFQNSIIDRYLCIIKLFYSELNSGKKEKKELDVIKGRVTYLSKKIADPMSKRLVYLFNPEEKIELSVLDKEAIKILDLYTKGFYSETISSIKQFLLQNPTCFEFYILYSKCLINESLPFEPLNAGNSLQNKILKETYEVLKKESNPLTHIQNLRKVAYQLSTLNISYQLSDFLLQESVNSNKLEVLNYLNSSFINPIFGNVYNNKSDAKAFIKNIDQALNFGSETAKFLFHNINHSLKDGLDGLIMPDSRKKIYTAKYLQEIYKYDEAIEIWHELLSINKNKPHIYETVVINLYNCYFEKGDIDKCIDLFVDTYFYNQFLTVKLNTNIVLEKIRENNFRGINININVPIFYRLSKALETRTTAACEKFLKVYSLKRPSQFIEKIKSDRLLLETQGDFSKIVFFLDKVCAPELFKHMVAIKGSKEKLNERLSIINYLEEIDTFNSTRYSDEKEEINRQLLIQEGFQANDESKIFINEKLIRTNLLNEIEVEFTRYKSMSKILEDDTLRFFVISTKTNHIKAISIKGKDRSGDERSFSTDPSFELIKGMFLELRDIFVDSVYGLKEYLSGRIRHGVFKSEIRPKFESLNLITEKDSIKGIYKTNEYWREQAKHFPSNINESVQEALAAFSKQIDFLIEEEVLQKYLHIRTEEVKNDGWFNYEFDDSELLIYSLILKSCETFPEFIDEMFNLLWARTDKNLEFIRNKFTNEVKHQFEEAIVTLDMQLRKNVQSFFLAELYQNINTSKVNIQNDLDRIARWFNRMGTQAKEFTLDKILEISIANANKGYEKRKIVLKKNIDCHVLFKGELYPSFIDLMYSFFKNTLEYCGLKEGDVETEATAFIEGDNLILKICNQLYGNIDETIKQLDAFKIEMVSSSDDRRSGLKKAVRTITYDFGNMKNSLTYAINPTEKKFEVKCVINLENLKHEGVNH